MTVKDLIDFKRSYNEMERMYVEELREFVRGVVAESWIEELGDKYFIDVEFRDKGEYGDYEVVVASVSDYLTDEVIGALVRQYGLVVTYKCSQTGFNLGTGEVNRVKKVYFRYADV